MRTLTPRRVRKARRIIAQDACPKAVARVRHRWAFDGYFWPRCGACRAVS